MMSSLHGVVMLRSDFFPTFCLVYAACPVPAAWTGGRDNSKKVGSSRGSKWESSSDNQQVIGVRDQALLQRSPAGISKNEVQIISRRFNHGTPVIHHFFIVHCVPITSSLRKIRVDSPAHNELSCRLLERTQGHDRHRWSLLRCTLNSRATKRKANNSFGIDGLGNLTRSHDQSISGCPVGIMSIGIKVTSVVRVAFDAVDNSLLHGN
mmetsp:Transcript_73897/g.214069  ORF Transcript_73897/g.214069 Transcript_73897/m.214069 type:complete len:208 (+) Transcript_73897:102-725(+)